jgi:hypothetical protein
MWAQARTRSCAYSGCFPRRRPPCAERPCRTPPPCPLSLARSPFAAPERGRGRGSAWPHSTQVLELEGVAGKDKLKQLKVDVGSGDPLQIVTNAPNVVEGCLCVVATVGTSCLLPAEPLRMPGEQVCKHAMTALDATHAHHVPQCLCSRSAAQLRGLQGACAHAKDVHAKDVHACRMHEGCAWQGPRSHSMAKK